MARLLCDPSAFDEESKQQLVVFTARFTIPDKNKKSTD